jgi:hypothetical protein
MYYKENINMSYLATTQIDGIEDGYGFEVENTPTDEMRTVIPYRLVGSAFSGSTIDTNYWTATAGSISGSVVAVSSQVILTTGSSTSGSSSLQSFRTARYVGGASLKFRTVLRLPDTGKTGNIRRWGAFNATDGAFYQLSGSALSLVTRKTSVDSPVDNGTFNGTLGSTYTLDTSVKTWEIYWTNSKVYFATGGELLHTFSASNDTWADTMSFPIRYENTSGSTTFMYVRTGTIYRLGNALSQPTSYYHASGQTTGVTLKIGAGNLHAIIMNSVTNGAIITLSDSVSATTPAITVMTASNTTTTPYTIDFKGLPFFNGLRLTVGTQNASATVIYE